jgi:hypothetical protein
MPAFVGPGETQAPAVLDHAGVLPQRDRCVGPAFAGRAEGSEGNLVIFDAGDVLNDALAVRRPGVDAESEVTSRCGRLRPFLPHSAAHPLRCSRLLPPASLAL